MGAFALGVTTENRSSDHSRLADHGRTVTARIEHADVRARRVRSATLSIAFETADGTTVSRSLGRRARDDASFDRLQVVYLPEDTAVVRPAGEKDPAKWRHLLAWLLAGGAIAASLHRRRRMFG